MITTQVPTYTFVGNGVRITAVDADDEIPDDIIAQTIKGSDGEVYKSGVFERITEHDGSEYTMYIIHVERLG